MIQKVRRLAALNALFLTIFFILWLCMMSVGVVGWGILSGSSQAHCRSRIHLLFKLAICEGNPIFKKKSDLKGEKQT